MGMPLHRQLSDGEWLDTERFDIFKYIADKIKRVDEVHQSELDDTSYIWLVWLKDPDDSFSFIRGLENNFNLLRMANDQWQYSSVDYSNGLIVVHTWI